MSNIPAPGSGYSDYSYGGALRNNFGADPYGSYSARENYSSGDSGDVEAYKQQLQAYYQNLLSVYNSLAAGDSRRAQCEQYLQTTREYAEQVDLQLRENTTSSIGSQWDPNGGAVASGLNIPISYQDANHIVTDEGPSTDITVRQTDSITKLIDVYQADNTLAIPSNAAVVSVNQVTEGRDVKWEVTIVLNGVTRKIVYHNAQREGFSLNIQAANPDQVTPNAALTSGAHAAKFTKTELGASSSDDDQIGDRYTRMDGQVRIFDGVSYDISPVPSGTNKETRVMASGDVSITPNSNEEYYTMAYQAGPPSKYIVTVYATEEDKTAGRKKETITIDGALVDHISFGGDPSRMEYLGALATSGDAHTLNATAPGASKITSSGLDELGGALNPDYETDTASDSTVGNTATYNTSANVDIHTNFDDTVNTHRITAPGEVQIHTSSYADTVNVSRSGTAPNYTYTVIVYKNGDSTQGTETYVISGPPSKIIIDGLPAKINPIGAAATDPIIQRGGNATSTDPNAPPATLSIDDLTTEIKNLKNLLPGISMEQFLSKLKAKFPNIDSNNDGKISKEELEAAQSNKIFPPHRPNKELVEFLLDLDPQLKDYVNSSNTTNDANYRASMIQASTRLKNLLDNLYPGKVTAPNINNADWRHANNLVFDGQIFEAFGEGGGNGTRGSVDFEWWA